MYQDETIPGQPGMPCTLPLRPSTTLSPGKSMNGTVDIPASVRLTFYQQTLTSRVWEAHSGLKTHEAATVNKGHKN